MGIQRAIQQSLLAAALCGLVAGASAQSSSGSNYPSKPIRMIVPYPPAGPTEVVGRPMIEKLSANMGQSVIADWRPGGNTIIGTDAVAKSAPDGYTWLFTTFTHTTMPSLSKNLPYNPLEDFSGVAMVANFPFVAVIPASLGPNTMAEFVALAKTQPGKFNYASAGIGSAAHLNAELLKIGAGINLVSVPYKGLAPALPDLLSGRVSFAFTLPALVLPHIRAGKLRALALASPKRIPLLPEVPTMAESGYPDAQVVAWSAILVPAKTPRDIVMRVNRELARALADPDVIRRSEAGGLSIESPMTPEEIDAMMKTQVANWAKFARQAGIEPQ